MMHHRLEHCMIGMGGIDERKTREEKKKCVLLQQILEP